jgi:hypothetical protein
MYTRRTFLVSFGRSMLRSLHCLPQSSESRLYDERDALKQHFIACAPLYYYRYYYYYCIPDYSEHTIDGELK